MHTTTPCAAPTQSVLTIEIRPLSARDAMSYRALRQNVLAIGDGQFFSDSFIREAELADDHAWEMWCTEKREHCIIGIFVDGFLSGVMAITAQGPKDSLVAEWEATWLAPQYRRQGIAKQAYQHVFEWTKQQGYEYAVVLIRDTNCRSRQIREKQGFIYMYTKYDEIWADGSIGNTNYFILDISAPAKQEVQAYERAISRLEATLVSLNSEAPNLEEAMAHRVQALRSFRQ